MSNMKKSIFLIILLHSIFQSSSYASNIKVIQTDSIESMVEEGVLDEVFRYMVATTHHFNEFKAASSERGGAIYAMGGIYIYGTNGSCLYLCKQEDNGGVPHLNPGSMGIFSSDQKLSEKSEALLKPIRDERKEHVYKQILRDHKNSQLSQAERLFGIVDTFDGKGIKTYVGNHLQDAEGNLIDQMCYDLMNNDSLREHISTAMSVVPFIFTERDPCRSCMISIGSFLKEKILSIFLLERQNINYDCRIKTIVGTLGHYREKTTSRKASHHLRYNYQWLDRGAEISDDLFQPIGEYLFSEDDTIAETYFDVALYHVPSRLAHESITGTDQSLYEFFKRLSISVMRYEDILSFFNNLFTTKKSYCIQFWKDASEMAHKKTKESRVINLTKAYRDGFEKFKLHYTDVLQGEQDSDLSTLLGRTLELKLLHFKIISGYRLEDEACILEDELKGLYEEKVKFYKKEKDELLRKATENLLAYHSSCLDSLLVGMGRKMPAEEKDGISDLDLDRSFNASNTSIQSINYLV